MAKLKCAITFGFLLMTITSCATSSSTIGNEDLQREYAAEYDEVYDQAVNAVTTLAWDLKQTEKESGLIQAETPAGALTSGDEVTVRITEGDNGKVKVGVTSVSNQAFDWGKNEKNISKLYEKNGRTVRSTARMITVHNLFLQLTGPFDVFAYPLTLSAHVFLV